MAIEVTNLSLEQGTSTSFVKEWFGDNSGDFFDSVELANNVISMIKNGETVMTMSYGVAATNTWAVSVNVNSSFTLTKSVVTHVRRLAKTPHGLAVGFGYSTGSVIYPYGVFITKTNTGALGVVLADVLNQNMHNNNDYHCESIGGTLRASENKMRISVSSSDVTSLTPFVCDFASGQYLPDCFVTTFSQYKDLDCTFTANGDDFLYNGAIAMR